jgi:hypothetical protein
MLGTYGIDDEEMLLDELARQKLAAQKDIPTGTVGPAPEPEAVMRFPEMDISAPDDPMARLPALTPMPSRVDLAKAREADAQARTARGFETAARQAIGGLTLTKPVEATTPEGTAEQTALADEARARADVLETRRGQMMERQRALEALLRPPPKAPVVKPPPNPELEASVIRKNNATAAKLERPPVPRTPKAPKDTGAKDASALRKEFDALPEVKEFKTVDSSFNKIQAAAKNVSAAGDLSLIFGYMKMLDPNSAVRETEFANAQNAGGVPDKIRAKWNSIQNGERLTESQRSDFIAQARGLHEAQRQQYSAAAQRYRALAEKQKLSPDDVAMDRTPSTGPSAAAAAPSDENAKALAWANANPSDPRAAAIKARLGVK